MKINKYTLEIVTQLQYPHCLRRIKELLQKNLKRLFSGPLLK